MKPTTFRNFLTEELLNRTKKNPRYSLRAFARSLGINDSTLSQIIHGKRPVTPDRIKHLGKRLGLPDKHIMAFLLSENRNQLAPDEIDVAIEKFNLIADWYYDAVIELVKIKDAPTDAKSVSKCLGITIMQAKVALSRLKKMEIILEDSDGRLICNQAKSLTSFYEDRNTTEALKNYQAQLLELSKKALAEQPRKKRNHTSYVIAIDSSMLDEINGRIRKFQHELATYIEEKGKNKDRVYALQFTNFEISRTGEIR